MDSDVADLYEEYIDLLTKKFKFKVGNIDVIIDQCIKHVSDTLNLDVVTVRDMIFTKKYLEGKISEMKVAVHQIDKKQLILEYLDKLRIKYFSEKDIFRGKAYANAIRVIKNYNGEIYKAEQFKGVQGIGSGIYGKIKEIIETGGLKLIDVEQQLPILKPVLQKKKHVLKKDGNKKEVLLSFMKVWGIGPKKAEELYKKGYRTIEELRSLDLDPSQKISLKWYNQITQKIPREYIDNIHNTLNGILRHVDRDATLKICGSYRRGSLESGDIDVLITTKNSKDNLLENYVDTLISERVILDTMSLGPKKFMGVINLTPHVGIMARRIDITYTTPKSWGASLLYFTGSASFNVKMRIIAKEHGYILNEYGLRKIGSNDYITTPTEESIFKILNMEYVRPKDRI